MRPSVRSLALLLLLVAVGLVLIGCFDAALAQSRNPFGVGISEGGGAPSGMLGWIMAQQIGFEQQFSRALRAVATNASALWALLGLCFAYGILHAAGPGHGKAVVASYMLANERALRRGLAISFLAALLQSLVAIAIIGFFGIVLRATAPRMTQAAHLVEVASFATIALLGAWLVFRKGRALLQLVAAPAPALAFAGAGPSARFACEPCDDNAASHIHGPDCGHVHMPDPSALGGERFSLRDAALTTFAAGIRPCSGAILVLVFALAQGVFLAGVAATLAMALGTALTTGALASLAVGAKGAALRLIGPGSRRIALLSRIFEFSAACLVLLLGCALLLGYSQAGF